MLVYVVSVYRLIVSVMLVKDLVDRRSSVDQTMNTLLLELLVFWCVLVPFIIMAREIILKNSLRSQAQLLEWMNLVLKLIFHRESIHACLVSLESWNQQQLGKIVFRCISNAQEWFEVGTISQVVTPTFSVDDRICR